MLIDHEMLLGMNGRFAPEAALGALEIRLIPESRPNYGITECRKNCPTTEAGSPAR